MSTELENIQAMEKQVFKEIASAGKEQPSLGNLFTDIDSGYERLFSSSKDPSCRYSYLRFLLQYMIKYSKDTFLFVEQTILEIWREILIEPGLPKDIEKSIQKVIKKKYITNSHAVCQIAITLYRHGKYKDAIHYFSMMEDTLDDAYFWSTWAGCYSAQEDFKGAVKILTRGFKRLPTEYSLGNKRGLWLYRLEKNDAALAQFQEIIDKLETAKFTENIIYLFSVRMKAAIYRDNNMPFQALLEYSRMSAAGERGSEEAMEYGQLMLEQIQNR